MQFNDFVKKPECIKNLSENETETIYRYVQDMFYVEDLFELDERLDSIKDEKLLQNIVNAYLDYMHYNYDANASHWDNVSSAHWYAAYKYDWQ